ncbi:hypothetical protein GL263_14460 [Streptomyces durbertensis]|uniref:CBM6 domain-containing protein n=1 Tax=Streptomyces durbertensis TaxID=2448886 RepID=A0ABR6EHE9_9ACTN|nr:hypothetical protein [Streptomyces durbertensis]MBB1244761.1 hypothetical protein [Streptomyces durbertensis]
MTAGNHGTNPPEGDDPFGYLYRSEGGEPAEQGQQAGVPRTSYNQVRAVGERRYGQQRPQQPAGQPGPNAYYAAPETQPGGLDAARASGGGGHGRSDAPQPRRRNGLLIGALAVVAAVVVGVGAAVAFSDDDGKKDQGQEQTPPPDNGGDEPDEQPGDEQPGDEDKPTKLPREDASSLRLDNGPQVGGDIPGSRARDGKYVHGFAEGAAVTWSTEVAKGGDYTVFLGYSVPGRDADSTLTVNGEAQSRPVRMSNFAGAGKDDWEKGWTKTYAWISLKDGANEIKVSCESGNTCEFALDQVWLVEGHVR